MEQASKRLIAREWLVLVACLLVGWLSFYAVVGWDVFDANERWETADSKLSLRDSEFKELEERKASIDQEIDKDDAAIERYISEHRDDLGLSVAGALELRWDILAGMQQGKDPELKQMARRL